MNDFQAHAFGSLFMSSRGRSENYSPFLIQLKIQNPRFQELQIPIDPIRAATWLPETDPHQNIEIVASELRNNEHEKRVILRNQHELPTLADTQ